MLNDILKRRTFAIVSHPDAGKTTITEKFLWYGSVIREAGHVKAKANRTFTTSDWMEIEKKRGISVSSSVINFPYGSSYFNLVDTPGHQDFCEDTFRALTAVDSALVLLDGVNGVERQTIKLMDVCRIRKTPIITFINKMDLDGRDPLDLLDEIEEVLKIKCAPFTLPVGWGKQLRGVYSIVDNTFHTFDKDADEQVVVQMEGPKDPKMLDYCTERDLEFFDEHYEMVTGAMEPFDHAAYLRGEQCPVFFGSAVNNFGVSQLLEAFSDLAPSPQAREADTRIVDPTEDNFSGYIFKIQANMDPRHRDRTAFLRVCSGKFERGARVLHCRSGKTIRLAAPTSFVAQDKTVLQEVFAGDIVGINDPGMFNIGDTLTTGEKFRFQGIPDFAPEYFARVILMNPMKSKQLKKGLDQLSEEGATQLYHPHSTVTPILGVVGELQFDVIKQRLESEYGSEITLERMSVFTARWIMGDKVECDKFAKDFKADCSSDKEGRLVCLFPNEYRMNLAMKNWESLAFAETSEG
jgi:peptide chain release factor 3